jgi:hypothetical protein
MNISDNAYKNRYGGYGNKRESIGSKRSTAIRKKVGDDIVEVTNPAVINNNVK